MIDQIYIYQQTNDAFSYPDQITYPNSLATHLVALHSEIINRNVNWKLPINVIEGITRCFTMISNLTFYFYIVTHQSIFHIVSNDELNTDHGSFDGNYSQSSYKL